MEIIGVAALIAIIWKVVDVIKYATNGNMRAVTTQLSVWGAAIAIVLLAREAEPFANVEIMGTTFDRLDLASTVLFALGLGSAASVGVDVKKAIDNTDSAAVTGDTRHRHVDRTNSADTG